MHAWTGFDCFYISSELPVRVDNLHSWLMSHWVMSLAGRLTGAAGPLLAASGVCSAATVQALAAPEIPLGSRPFSAGIKYPAPEAVVGAQVSDSQLLPRYTPSGLSMQSCYISAPHSISTCPCVAVTCNRACNPIQCPVSTLAQHLQQVGNPFAPAGARLCSFSHCGQ